MSSVIGSTLMSASLALSGGFVTPVDEPVIVAPVDTAPVYDWAGPYVGFGIGYSFGADDEVGLETRRGGATVQRNNDIGNVDVEGFTGNLHAGYNWVFGNWVVGPEVAIEGGSVDDSFSRSGTDTASGTMVDVKVKSEVNWIASAKVKAGYLVRPQTQIYGLAGISYGDFDYTLDMAVAGVGDFNQKKGYNRTDYILGVGVEHKFRPNLSVFAEYQFREYGKEDVTFSDAGTDLITRATPKHSNISLGLNYAF
ncbi:MAG: outer membrane protein [Paracoccus sp. (in: a-proteobacteria)]